MANIQILLFVQKLVMCCPSRFYTKQIRRYQRHLKSWNSCILSIPDTNTFMPLIVIYFYYSNRFMEASSYIIHNLPPHQPQQACLARISLTAACFFYPLLKRVACLQALLWTQRQSVCPCISSPYRSFTPGSKELQSYLQGEDYQKPFTDF